ncbi:dipeptidyl carboxydipeptidase family protein [Dictyocaulus viviparus]|uniref:Angiotensin-converting enzyme n=1 Tax=Dictyocaulus viviparus TaxID=29172 RepID=A0A0D8XD89_DICVI|nr:dipeptidyl carboxydipeptidase family protein [Dictyocaulus viviparus]
MQPKFKLEARPEFELEHGPRHIAETRLENGPVVDLKTPISEPEPAIKFDNIMLEDYGDVVELLVIYSSLIKKNQPDELDTEVIEQLVDRFLNTGSLTNKNASKFANPTIQALIGSSSYWNTDDLKVLKEVAAAGWKYFSHASPGAKQSLNEAEQVLSRFVRSTSMQAKQFDVESIKDANVKRQLAYILFEGMSALSPSDYAKFNQAQNSLNRVATDVTICDKGLPPPCALKKIDLESIFRSEKDATRLSHLWISYLTNLADVKSTYQTLIELTNKGAKLNGFPDGGSMWRSAFDLPGKGSSNVFDMRTEIEKIYHAIEPLYKHLHAYMRRQISGIYGNPIGLSRNGPIPAHLFGSVSGGDWSSHFEQTKPFDEQSTLPEDMLFSFHTQNYTTKQMFVKAYRFFKSIGFPPLPKTFWTNSHFSRVWSRDMICSPPAALDMRDGKDYRVKACAQLGMPDFELAHSLMAQIYYQYLYRDQPLLFREPASSSISDAIAKVFAHLSADPRYLYSQKLVTASHLDIKDSLIINKLYKEALENIAKLPFNIVADNWRYELFEGKIPVNNINDRWWELRAKYEGVRAPQPYNSSNLDALMHAAISQIHSPATKSLISYVLQFQILKALCPPETILSEGCILSEVTTEKLRETMMKGSSITWLEALKMITGEGLLHNQYKVYGYEIATSYGKTTLAKLDAAPLLEYFEPLSSWLRNTNEVDQSFIGWDGDGTIFNSEEIPKPRTGMDGGSGILSEDRVAFPGGICANGQECLLDSKCNGTICVCNDGLYTLEIGETINCVPGNPADSGFGDGKGGLVIGLFSSETTPNPEPQPEPTPEPKDTSISADRSKSSATVALAVSSLLLIIVFC